MNREIKFKFWLGRTKQMTNEHSLFEITQADWDFTSDIIPLQYTGLVDNTETEIHQGTEIYEGDIVRIPNTQRDYVVKFHSGCFKLFRVEPKLHDLLWGPIERVTEQGWTVEVVGNIYENPELLTHENE